MARNWLGGIYIYLCISYGDKAWVMWTEQMGGTVIRFAVTAVPQLRRELRSSRRTGNLQHFPKGLSLASGRRRSCFSASSARLEGKKELEADLATLEKKTRLFLDSLSKIRSSGDSATISSNGSSLIFEWAKLWQRDEIPLKYIGRGVVRADNLLSVLFDERKESFGCSIGGLKSLDLEPLCNMTITGWARSDFPDRTQRATAILERFEQLAGDGKTQKLGDGRPTFKTYNALIDAYAKSDDEDSVEKCLALIGRMTRLHSSGQNPFVKPERITYNGAIDACARRGDVKNAARLCDEMERLWREGDESLMPDAFSFSSMINALTRSGRPDAGKRAEAILRKMDDIYSATRDTAVLLNQVTLGACIALYANNPREKHNAENAERLLDFLITLYTEHSRTELRPNESHFATVMNCYARSGGRDSGRRAEAVLEKLETMYRQTGHVHLKPSHKTFTICITALSRSIQGAYDLKRAEDLLGRMEKLFVRDVDQSERMNSYPYNIITNRLARSGGRGSADRVQKYIERMTLLAEETDTEDLLPDTLTYTSLLRALVNENTSNSFRKASLVLSHMEELSGNGNGRVQPDVIAYATVINGYARQGNVRQVELMFHRMKENGLHPNTFCYNVLLNALARSGKENSASRAEEVLWQMDSDHRNGNRECKPSSVSFLTCINAHARSSAPNRMACARSLYNEVLRRYKADDKDAEDLKPKLDTHVALLNAVARSDEPDKVRQALDIMSRIRADGLKLNRVPYNLVLNACAHGDVKDRKEALGAAVKTFQALRSDPLLGADWITYSYLIRIVGDERFINNDAERFASLEDLFIKCCHDGQLNQKVIQALYQAAPPDLFWKLVKCKSSDRKIVRVDDLPSEWSRNAIFPRKVASTMSKLNWSR